MLPNPLRPPERVPVSGSQEIMDRDDVDRVELERALDALALMNRLTGVRRRLWRALRSALPDRGPGELRLLDVGAGGGDVALYLLRRLRELGWRPRLCLADRHPLTLRTARSRLGSTLSGEEDLRRIRFVRLDAERLPFARDAFDFALSSTVLHHLDREPATRFLAEMDRVATAGWAVSDLRRSRLGYAAVRLLAWTIWRRRRLPRTDGPLSVLRSFTAAEARDLLRRAELTGARVERRPPFRLLVTGGERVGKAA